MQMGSVYYETKMDDPEFVAEAIRIESEGKLQPEVHLKAQALKGRDMSYWKGEAEVIIRNKDHGGWHDIGFKRQPGGGFKVLLSDRDQHRFGEQWLKRIGQRYTEAKIMAMFRRHSY